MLAKTLPKHIIDPPVLVETNHFLVKLAESQREVEKALRLRYEVFNLEMGKGLKSADEHGIDCDKFDEYCLHLLVIEKKTSRVIGTYRVHLGFVANFARGFYSSREYDIDGLDSISSRCIELGRSCISREFRTGAVVILLWSAITKILMRARITYMLGCVSLEETDPRIGWALYEYFSQNHSMCNTLKATARSEFRLKHVPKNRVEKFLSNNDLARFIPPLFKGYLRLGALVCGEPAFDSEFGTIDFLILVNIDKVPIRYRKHFNYRKV